MDIYDCCVRERRSDWAQSQWDNVLSGRSHPADRRIARLIGCLARIQSCLGSERIMIRWSLDVQSQSGASDRTVVRTPFLHDLFEAQAMRRPDHPAIECKGSTLTYSELDCLANQYAHFFHTQGLRPGCLVALYLEKSVELFGALLGVLKAGLGYVPIDPKFPVNRIRSIIEDGAISVVVSQTSLSITLENSDFQILLVDRDHDKIEAMPNLAIPAAETGVKANDICYVIYTSGSTGRPKG